MMRKSVSLALPLALAACASPPQVTPVVQSVASAAKAERPAIRVGDRWKFACSGGSRVWVATSVDATGIRGTENGRPLLLSVDLRELESPRGTHSGDSILRFPLEVGKQWTGKSDYAVIWASSEWLGSEEFNVTVDGYEKLRVPAGEFDVFELKYKSTWSNNRGGSGTNSATYWYAPEARAIVKYDLKSNVGDACELVEIQLKP